MKFYSTSISILLFIFISLNIKAQTPYIDSLIQVIENTNISDTDKVISLNLLGSKLFRVNNQLSNYYLKKAINIAKEIDYTDGIMESTRLLGVNQYYSSNFDTAHILLFKSLRYYTNINDKKYIAKCLVDIGNVFLVKNQLDSALKYYNKALPINKEINNKKGIATNLGNIGLIYKRQDRFPEALNNYNKALKIYQEEGNLRDEASLINKIGIINIRLGKLDEALKYNKQALKLSREINDKLGEAMYLNNLGVIYSKCNKNDSALLYYKKSLKLKLKLKNTFNISSMYVNIGAIICKEGSIDEAIVYYFKALDLAKSKNNKFLLCKIYNTIGGAYYKKGDYKKSKYYIYKSIAIAKKTNLTQLEAINRYILSNIYSQTKDYQKAFENYKIYSVLTDSINKKQNIEKISELELDYKYKEQNKIIELDQEKKRAILSKEIKNQRKTKNIFIILFIVAALAIIQFIRLLTIRKKTNKVLQLKNQKIEKQSLELEKKSEELTLQKTLLEEKVKERTSELIIEKEKAEESDKLKTAILNNISHEFRTPMNGIIGFSSLIVKQDITQEEKDSYSKIIISSCNQLLNVVTDTVDISKINSNQCKLIKSKTNIKEITVSVVELLKDNYEEKGLTVDLLFELENNKLEIETDKNKLERILWHLINNAIKFTQKGKINITISFINNFINFKIIDTGKGIPNNMQTDIFKPFIQLNNLQDETITGNGFGLPITKAYIELLGGEIEINSIIDIGTTVNFTIPYNEVYESKETKNNFNKNNKSQKTILLAEDDEINAFLIEKIFSKYNINLIIAINGKEATEIFKSQHSKIDIVMLDLRMPIMNGFEAISIIKKINSETPIIAYTAYCSKTEITEIVNAGFDDYISKPIKKEELMKIISKY